MQANQYEFEARFVKKNGKRLKRQELLCEVEDLATEYAKHYGVSSIVTHYDHLTYSELVCELRDNIKNIQRIKTK
jgi:hypothetical protein